MPNKCYCYIVAWVVSVAQQLSQLLLLLVLLLSLLYTFMMPPSRPLCSFFSPSPFIRFSKNKSKSAKILLNFKQNKLLSVEKSSEREKERRQVRERMRERGRQSSEVEAVPVLCYVPRVT